MILKLETPGQTLITVCQHSIGQRPQSIRSLTMNRCSQCRERHGKANSVAEFLCGETEPVVVGGRPPPSFYEMFRTLSSIICVTNAVTVLIQIMTAKLM